MDARECAALLAQMAQYDYRDVDDAITVAWMRLIGDLNYADAQQAVLDHYGECRERMMPADVISRVRAIRAERLRITPLPERPPADPVEYRRWKRENIRRIADGDTGPAAIDGAS